MIATIGSTAAGFKWRRYNVGMRNVECRGGGLQCQPQASI